MIEIIASTLRDAMNIEKGGGDRIELVSALSEGGLTPSIGLIKSVINSVKIPVYVMLRPIGHSFNYEVHHLDVMKSDAEFMESVGVKQVVIGLLDDEGLPAIEELEYVLKDTNLSATFHRAYDYSSDLKLALERINSCEIITHLLTSGGPGSAADNVTQLKYVLEKSRPKVVLGSGINHDNIYEIMKQLGNRADFDIHVGTAVRNGEVHDDVDFTSLEEFIKIVKS